MFPSKEPELKKTRTTTNAFEPKFLLQKTNALWNVFEFNAIRNVGKVAALSKQKEFVNYQEWKAFYLASGLERKERIASRPKEIQDLLLKPLLSEEEFSELSKEDKAICCNYGRTEEEIEEKAVLLSQLCAYLHPSFIAYDKKVWAQLIYYRLLAETWNGCIVAELNTRELLVDLFPLIEWRLSSEATDTTYAIDVEGYVNNQLLLGIQVKPTSYRKPTNNYAFNKQKELNENKMARYTKQFQVPTAFLYHEAGKPFIYDKFSEWMDRLSNREESIERGEE